MDSSYIRWAAGILARHPTLGNVNKRKATPVVERRFVPLSGIEVRQSENAGQMHFRGHAAVFNQMAEIAGMFREQVDPAAFNKTIREADVRFLYNHEPDSVMARTTNETLRLSTDATGLVSDADLDPSDWDVQRILPKLQSGNVNQMSFAFRTIKDDWEEEPEDEGLPIRTLLELQLFDVSPVTFPAYEGTDAELVSVRALADANPRVQKLLDRAVENLGPDLTIEPQADSKPPDETEEPSRHEHSLSESQALRRRRLEYLETTL